MTERKRSNEIVEETAEFLTVDISTPSHPDALMKISRKDWNFLQTNAIGRVRASNFGSFEKTYPVCKLRGKARSVLFILFRSPRAVKCISEDWCDLRRENLADGANLKHPGEEGFSKRKAYRLPPNKSGGAKKKPIVRKLNEVLKKHTDGSVTIDVSSKRFPDAHLRICEKDLARLVALGSGPIRADTALIGCKKWLPYCRIITKVAADGKLDRPRMTLHTALFGSSPKVEYLTKDWEDIRHSNLHSRVINRPAQYRNLEGEEGVRIVEDIGYYDGVGSTTLVMPATEDTTDWY